MKILDVLHGPGPHAIDHAKQIADSRPTPAPAKSDPPAFDNPFPEPFFNNKLFGHGTSKRHKKTPRPAADTPDFVGAMAVIVFGDLVDGSLDCIMKMKEMFKEEMMEFAAREMMSLRMASEQDQREGLQVLESVMVLIDHLEGKYGSQESEYRDGLKQVLDSVLEP